jgi:hypothetical protein
LSPPIQLRDAAKHSPALPFDETMAAVEEHFDKQRPLYLSSSGDGYFWMVERDIRRLWEYPSPDTDVIGRPRSSNSIARHSAPYSSGSE